MVEKTNEVWLGSNEEGELFKARLDADRRIICIDGYQPIHKDQVYEGGSEDNYLICVSSGFEPTIGRNRKYCRGQKLIETPKLKKRDLHIVENYYESDGLSACSACGLHHDTASYSRTWVLLNECEIYCKDCVSALDLVKPLEDENDLFSAPDISGMDQKGLKIVETLFCDSSGFGSAYERALTKDQAKSEVKRIIDKNKKIDLFVGITDIGQFQVYVTVFKKVKTKGKVQK
jgi:hypothetical protein